MKANEILATALLRNGNYAEAEVINCKLLVIAGDNDPAIAHNLAGCMMYSTNAKTRKQSSCRGSHLTLGEYSECEAIYRETLVMQRKIFGAEHEDTKRTAGNLQRLIDNGHAAIQTLS